VTAEIAPLEPLVWFQLRHMKHCTVLPPHTKLLKWPTYHTLQMENKSYHPTHSQKTLKTKQYQSTRLITALCDTKQGILL